MKNKIKSGIFGVCIGDAFLKWVDVLVRKEDIEKLCEQFMSIVNCKKYTENFTA